jgi:AraC-like DNA-binding protein
MDSKLGASGGGVLHERDRARGVLYPSHSYEHLRWDPAPGLERWVEKHWTVGWDLAPGERHVQHVLTHPSAHLVDEGGEARVYGVGTGRFDRVLEGSGRAVGTKFRPGALYSFTHIPMFELTGKSVAVVEAFGNDASGLDAADTEAVDAFLLARLPEPDEAFELVAEAARLTLEDPEVVRVEDLAGRLAVSVRTLQRLFRERVGVTPKWLLRRYRLHEAAERITDGDVHDWAAFALELGYFDQAHFIRDFKAVVGRTPADYAAARTPA